MKSRLINYTDKGLKKLLIEEILRINPLLTMGDDLGGPVQSVRDGRTIEFTEPAPAVKPIQLDRLPENFEHPPKLSPVIMAKVANPIKISMKDIEDGELDSLNFRLEQPMYFHFYRVDVPHREWLEEYDVGDLAFTTVLDQETFNAQTVPVTLTQEIMDQHSYVTLRFALST